MTKNILDFDRFIEDSSIDEGLIMTYPIMKTVSYIQKNLNIDEDTIDVMYPG